MILSAGKINDAGLHWFAIVSNTYFFNRNHGAGLHTAIVCSYDKDILGPTWHGRWNMNNSIPTKETSPTSKTDNPFLHINWIGHKSEAETTNICLYELGVRMRAAFKRSALCFWAIAVPKLVAPNLRPWIFNKRKQPQKPLPLSQSDISNNHHPKCYIKDQAWRLDWYLHKRRRHCILRSWR